MMQFCISCASMQSAQPGSAADFDTKDVINRFSETGSNSSASDLNVFMTSLIGVDADTFESFDNAAGHM
jgi:hypothetical protein